MQATSKIFTNAINGKSTKLAALLMLLATLNGCAVATVVAVTAGATVIADRRTFSKQIDDQSIKLVGHNKINKEKALSKNSNLQIVSLNGTVLIVGQAANTYLRDLAITTIQDIPDIVTIHNQIRIGPNVSAFTKSNDIWITSKVKSALLANADINTDDFKIVTEDSEVFLMGLVTQREADIAVDITRNINGVDRVYKAFEYIE
ncbi:BON domain-containing protein [Colwellia sp. E2M01]|uniref:BON domain-containing protein n=1 Tax=Colwellia sp. E2M01 TaxID=2841561 RepID=UPI001C09E562|nr:BON domain-containing protein [Colwellia sp. E2M01]MBU2870192.1 BON domain-containing protein [Colwellia sp. E2M01]